MGDFWIKRLSDVLKEAGDLGFGHLELGFAEELGELGIEFDEVIAKVGDVKGFEFLEDLRGEDVVDAFKLGSASSDVAWDESVKLFKNTVTKGKLEVLDDKVIELSELLKGLSGDWEVAIGFGIKLH